MPLRNSFKYKDIKNILEHFECSFDRRWHKKSHEVWYSPRSNDQVVVPNHWPKEIKIWTLFSILKQAWISKEEVIQYLNK